MELFENDSDDSGQPLAYRMRPRTIEEFVGQEHIVGPGRLLRRVIQADQLSSLIFYGPPGTGKTTLARVIANTTKSHFITMNAVLSGVKNLREAIEEAKTHKNLYARRTILFVDEVHRWNKAQQDALLPSVENGTVILIGATTQNPYFEVNSALVSRSRIFQLKPLSEGNLRSVVDFTLHDPIRGYGKYAVNLDPEALDHLVKIANGDARSLLNAVELAVETTPERFPPETDEQIHVTLETAEESIQRKVILYDKEGDYHFDTISAFIKSLRGSDPDAALYWMAKMVRAGEDPHFIFRRMLILASEDVGMADPNALVVVEAAAAAFDRVGMPEGQFHLTHAVLYLANASKSNSTLAYFDALKAVEHEADAEVPNHLRDASRDKEGFGHGEGYVYPHAYRDHWIAQQYLPSSLQGRIFYQPSEQGYESALRDTVQRRRESQLAATSSEAPDEVLTFSPPDRNRDRWIARITSGRSRNLEDMRNTLFQRLKLQRHDRVLDVNAGSGLLIWEAFRHVPEGGVWGIVQDSQDFEVLQHYSKNFEHVEQPSFLNMELQEGLKELNKGGNHQFDIIIGRNVFTRIEDKAKIITAIHHLLSEAGGIGFIQTIPSKSQRLSELITVDRLPRDAADRFRLAEDSIYTEGWDEQILNAVCIEAGFSDVVIEMKVYYETRQIEEKHIQQWMKGADEKPTFGVRIAETLTPEEIELVTRALIDSTTSRQIEWKTEVAFLFAKA